MSAAFHQVVWLDHQSARLYDASSTQAVETALIRAPHGGAGHIHHKAGTPGPGHERIATAFLHQIGEALRGAGQILIVGPADAKTALKTYLEDHFPSVGAKVVGVEPMGRAGPGEIHALAKRVFAHADRMAPGPGTP